MGVVAGEYLGDGVGLLQSPKPELGAEGAAVGEPELLVEMRLPPDGRLLNNDNDYNNDI